MGSWLSLLCAPANFWALLPCTNFRAAFSSTTLWWSWSKGSRNISHVALRCLMLLQFPRTRNSVHTISFIRERCRNMCQILVVDDGVVLVASRTTTVSKICTRTKNTITSTATSHLLTNVQIKEWRTKWMSLIQLMTCGLLRFWFDLWAFAADFNRIQLAWKQYSLLAQGQHVAWMMPLTCRRSINAEQSYGLHQSCSFHVCVYNLHLIFIIQVLNKSPLWGTKEFGRSRGGNHYCAPVF